MNPELTDTMKQALKDDQPYGFKLHVGSSDRVKIYHTTGRRATIDALVARGLMQWRYRWANAYGDDVYDLEITAEGQIVLEGIDEK